MTIVPLTRETRLRVFGATVGLFAVLAATPLATGATTDKADKCGARNGQNAVRAEFAISATRDIWKYLPAMGIAPDLAAESGPGYVVVFRDPFDASGMTAVDMPLSLSGVVCVIPPDGNMILFSDVSMSGAVLR